ncbi:alpha/beta fold hydrolase [Pseudomonas frederiksbergensis]|uniref:Alpha/beta hydrolase n=1 Tax=Pseudomonas frederiksbergensis TaxID=104087 RepID=A0A423HNY6_9PSED|nr:alpha/beta hydrolase [Pseudomonas frederiksbergensis]RON14958.1 alpha/beta hydrolase [Pseudomonas frederiksbergensis]
MKNHVTAKDGTQIFFRDFGQGRPIVFSHGWPLNSDAWDGQMQFFANAGFRVIAHDRRGHGRSDQPAGGNDMDTFADDLAVVIETLDLKDAVLVGHSMGGGEIVRYVTRHGTDRIAKLVLLGAITPLMGATDGNTDGVSIEVVDGVRKAILENRSQLFLDFSSAFFGLDPESAAKNEGWRMAFWQQGMSGAIHSQYACIEQFWASDFREEMKSIFIPVLVIHGSGDFIVPLETTGKRSAEILPNATLKVYEGAAHGFPITHQTQLNADLIEFASH